MTPLFMCGFYVIGTLLIVGLAWLIAKTVN